MKIVVVSETAKSVVDHIDDHRLRSPSARYVAKVVGYFVDAGFEVVTYGAPDDLADHAREHARDVVVSLWHGTGSRNQTALVPAICEAYGVCCIGADASARALCEDKHLTRCFAASIGLTVPEAVLIRTQADLEQIALPAPPVVVKPISGGMSQGVFLCTAGDPRADVTGALSSYARPVLVERFCAGREVMIVLLGRSHDIELLEACEVTSLHDDRYFETRIFDASLKQTMSKRDWSLRRVTDALDPDILRLCARAFGALGEVDVLRIDGRWDGERFSLLELTPTPGFQDLAALTHAGRWNGMDRPAIARRLAQLARDRNPSRLIRRS